MWRVLLVAFGGSMGSVARYWLAGIVQRTTQSDLPLGTLAVNAAGSFLIGVILASSFERGTPGPAARTLLTVGFCGGFTTMSTFSYETLALLRDGEIMMAAVNIAVTMGLCLTAVWLGDAFARML